MLPTDTSEKGLESLIVAALTAGHGNGATPAAGDMATLRHGYSKNPGTHSHNFLPKKQ